MRLYAAASESTEIRMQRANKLRFDLIGVDVLHLYMFSDRVLKFSRNSIKMIEFTCDNEREESAENDSSIRTITSSIHVIQ